MDHQRGFEHRPLVFHRDLVDQWTGAGRGWLPRRHQRTFQRRTIQSSHGNLDGNRFTEYQAPGSYSDFAARWTGAGGRGLYQLLESCTHGQCGTVRSGHGELDGDWIAEHRTLAGHSNVAVRWKGADRGWRWRNHSVQCGTVWFIQCSGNGNYRLDKHCGRQLECDRQLDPPPSTGIVQYRCHHQQWQLYRRDGH